MRPSINLVGILLLALAASLNAQQPGGEWVQPYRQMPDFWELVARLYPDSPALRRDRDFRGFLDPAVVAAGSIKPRTTQGDIAATFVRFDIVGGNNVLNAGGPPDRLVVADVQQVGFVSADSGSLRVEVRNGNPSSEFQQCFDSRHTRFAHLTDVRVQAVMLCEGSLFWTSWRTQTVALDSASRSTMVLDNLGTLLLTYDPNSRAISAIIQAPALAR